jgi:[acyl-carrier-protein] S-malonyltransferase
MPARLIALLCPGQGAQSPGMGRDLAHACPAAARVFSAANERLNIELDRLCFEGPADELASSDVAQPAILTVSVAAFRALEHEAGRFPPVAACAGLSLGEYSALVMAGALDFADAVALVRERGRHMQEACEANPGTMCSVIGLEDSIVEDACAQATEETGAGVWPANYNCPGQLVVSGQVQGVRRAAEICRERGARRAVHLNVAGPFHTPLMALAAERLAPELARIDIRCPRWPVVANVTASPADQPQQIRALLLQQVTSPVRWTDSMHWVARQGVSACYELGPGRVLQGLLKRIDPSFACRSLGAFGDIAAAASDWRGGTP